MIEFIAGPQPKRLRDCPLVHPTPALKPLANVRVDSRDPTQSFGVCPSCRRTRHVPNGVIVCPFCAAVPR